MTVGMIVFLFVIVIAVIVVAGAIAVYAARNLSSKNFDERQMIDRGNAYRFSHWIGMIYFFGLFTYFTFHTGKNEWVLEPFLLVMIGILIQLQSFHIYCVMTHSALPLGEKPLPTIIGYTVLGSMNLVQYFSQYIPKDAVGITGAASYNLVPLLIALDFFSFAVLHLIAMLRKEKE